MTLCWAQEPLDRPSASVIGEIVKRPEFCHLYQAVSMEEQDMVMCAVCAPHIEAERDWDEGLQFFFFLLVLKMIK